jgi:hypothetical protein
MLDLMRWKRVSETSDSIGCKAVGEKVPLFYRDGPWDGKKHFGNMTGWQPEVQVPWGLLIVDF